jgi:hypothetical protein
MKRLKTNKKDLRGVTTLAELKDKVYPPWTFRRFRYNIRYFFFRLRIKWDDMGDKIKKYLDDIN